MHKHKYFHIKYHTVFKHIGFGIRYVKKNYYYSTPQLTALHIPDDRYEFNLEANTNLYQSKML